MGDGDRFGPWRRLARVDPSLVNLRSSVVVMGAMLASYGTTLALEHAEGLGVDVVIRSVVFALSLARTQQGIDLKHRLFSFAVMPVLAVAAAKLGVLIATHADIGDGVFVLAVSATIWIGRFGPTTRRIATMAALPLISILILQGSPVTASVPDQSWWAGAVALIAAFWVFTVQAIAGVTGLRPDSASAHGGPAARPDPPRPRARSRIPVSTRMALQMGVAVGVAFAAGRLIWPSHWTWTVLTAFIVCSGARSRGDVIHKGALRILGAGVGTVLGTLIASTFAPLDHTSVVVIFAVLAVGTWLRPFSYAYWAASVTAVLSLLYGYFGASATSLLHTRLEAILLGALIGIASSWMVLPTRSSDVLRSRLAAVLAALSDLLKPGPRDRATLTRQQARFDHSVHLLEQIAAPFEAHRRVTRHRRAAPGNADTFDAIRRSIAPVHALIQCANNDDDVLASPRVACVQSVIAGNIGALRRQIAGMPGSDHRPLPRTTEVPGDNPDAEVIQILADIDSAITDLARTIPARPTATSTRPQPADLHPAGVLDERTDRRMAT